MTVQKPIEHEHDQEDDTPWGGGGTYVLGVDIEVFA